MPTDHREVWVGTADRFGILQRLGVAFILLSFATFAATFEAPSRVSLFQFLFSTAYALLYSGFLGAAVADRLASRSFSYTRLGLTATFTVVYAILQPVFMSAAFAASK